MDYKYQRKQIFGKRLKVPKGILNKVYKCRLSFNEFIEYQLDDKIPTSCIKESDRKIVEKFGINKCKELDVEISICPRTDKIEFSTDVSLSSKLDAIKEQYPDSYIDVLSNIVYAKEFFKNINAYKSLKSDSSQGGLGGIGIENWILQHGGSFIDAASDFIEIADKAETFESFCSMYQVYDLGSNHYSDKSNIYPHDNFVGDNNKMGKEGYERIVSALKKYLKSLEKDSIETESIKR